MSNEELFFGLTQGLRKFPKETGRIQSYQITCKMKLANNNFFGPLLADKVLCHFCFKPKKVTDEVLKSPNGRKSQMLISDIIVLKIALDALPFLSMVNASTQISLKLLLSAFSYHVVI